MITHIKGKLTDKNPTYAVIETNGVGYWLNISLHTYTQLPDSEEVFLYTHLYIKEDGHTLFGFSSRTERELFRLLISVSGVGPSIARTMLSSMSPEEIQQAIALGDVGIIQSVKGIGLKTAQRVIVDLKDKISKSYAMGEVSVQKSNTNKFEALSALEVLGFASKQSEKTIDKILLEDPTMSVEALIKSALKML